MAALANRSCKNTGFPSPVSSSSASLSMYAFTNSTFSLTGAGRQCPSVTIFSPFSLNLAQHQRVGLSRWSSFLMSSSAFPGNSCQQSPHKSKSSMSSLKYLRSVS